MAKHPIFDKEDYGSTDARDALARFFRGLLLEFGVTKNRWSDLLTRYVIDPAQGFSARKRQHERGNLAKALEKDHMTFRTFCQGLRVLEGDKADIYVVLHRGKRRTLKKIRIDLGPEVVGGITPNTSRVNNVHPDADVDEYLNSTTKDDE